MEWLPPLVAFQNDETFQTVSLLTWHLGAAAIKFIFEKMTKLSLTFPALLLINQCLFLPFSFH
jgi:hypothetical protein